MLAEINTLKYARHCFSCMSFMNVVMMLLSIFEESNEIREVEIFVL